MEATEELLISRALRALQRYDEVSDSSAARGLLMEAESLLGEALGLECTGVLESEQDHQYSHSAASTCPVHEWLDVGDHAAVHRFLDARDALRPSGGGGEAKTGAEGVGTP